MTTRKSSGRSWKGWVFAGVCLLLLAGVPVALLARSHDERDAPRVPPDLSAASLEKQFNDPDQLARTLDNLFNRTDLSEEQRRQVFDNMRQIFEAQIDRHVDEYFAAATPDEKSAVLDRHIDEFQTRMKAWEKHRKEWEQQRQRQPQPGGAGGDGQARSGNSADRPPGAPGGPPRGWGDRFRTREGRKEMSESRDPDRVARRMAYFGAAMARAQQRGIDVPSGRGGPPRGRGA